MSEITQVNFRMPQELKDLLENTAKDNGRSITQEVVNRIEQSFGLKDKSKRNIIFTEWQPSHLQLEDSGSLIEHNEKVRMACAKFMSSFFQDYSDHELISFEFKHRTQLLDKKDQDVLYGIRVWYSYPVGQ